MFLITDIAANKVAGYGYVHEVAGTTLKASKKDLIIAKCEKGELTVRMKEVACKLCEPALQENTDMHVQFNSMYKHITLCLHIHHSCFRCICIVLS